VNQILIPILSQIDLLSIEFRFVAFGNLGESEDIIISKKRATRVL